MARFRDQGLRNFEALLKSHPVITRKAAALALNFGARRAVTLGSTEIAKQVNLKQGYIKENLKITQFANPNQLVAVVSARQRATSLRRFNASPASRKGRKSGVRVTVKRGARKLIRRGFILSLRRGDTGALGNEGVAIRLKSGESIEHKKVPFDKDGDPGLYLLYGPSVDQVFQTVRDDIHPKVSQDMNTEFTRQWARLRK